jgi:hypothetical protein
MVFTQHIVKSNTLVSLRREPYTTDGTMCTMLSAEKIEH